MLELIGNNFVLFVCGLALVGSIMLMLLTLLVGRNRQVEARLASDTNTSTRRTATQPPRHRFTKSSAAIPKLGDAVMPNEEEKKGRIRSRVLQAGFYQRHAASAFLGIKLLLALAPMCLGAALAMLNWIPLPQGVLFGAVVGLLGTVAPGIWLDAMKKNRQKRIKRSLPDALDVIVICLEGGLSLPAAFARVGDELATAHPLLADEMAIVKREIQLGKSTGEALRRFANRFDIDDIRSMASVVSQAERFGASVTKALRVHADGLRLKRHQHAEAQAQKAPVKLIFPTVLFIFPALYIVLMVPAGVQIVEALKSM